MGLESLLLGGALGFFGAQALTKKPNLPNPQGLPAKTVEPEAAKARLDMAERLRRVKASREQSRLTLPRMFDQAETKKSILADTLG